MRAQARQKPVIIKTRIDTENIDVGHLLHIYNFHRLPMEVQEAMISFVPVYSQMPSKKKAAPVLLCVEGEAAGQIKHYIAPSMLTEFCSENASRNRSFQIVLSPNAKNLLDKINFSCLEPPYLRNAIAAIKLANAISKNEVKVSFAGDAIIFVCDVEKNFRFQDFEKALGLPMKGEVSRQGDVDVFRLSENKSEGVTLEAIQNAVFKNFGNLLVQPKDQKALNVIESYFSRGRQ